MGDKHSCEDAFYDVVGYDDDGPIASYENATDNFYDACSSEEFNATEPSSCSEKHNSASVVCEPSEGNDEMDPLLARMEIENALSNDELLKQRDEAVKIKENGNSQFKNNNFEEAIRTYTHSLDICPVKFASERAKILSNRAACNSKLGNRNAALSDCDEALRLEPDYLRCLLRRAELRESVDRFTEALEDYQRIVTLDPGNAKSRAACALLPDKIIAHQEKLKTEMMQQLKQLGNIVLKPFGLSTDNFQLTQDPNSGGYSVKFQQ